MSNYTLLRKQYFGGEPMNAWDAYRVRAAELRASAKKETRRDLAEEFEDLARAYLLLAEMAERNGQLDLAYETPVKKGEDDKQPRRR
jgi:hypothetical protein